VSVADLIKEWGAVAAAITAILLLGGLVFRHLVYRPLVRLIDDRTAQIQPSANGGTSLPDAIRILHHLERRQGVIAEKIDAVEAQLDAHIEYHQP
jgi:hypothetical protein